MGVDLRTGMATNPEQSAILVVSDEPTLGSTSKDTSKDAEHEQLAAEFPDLAAATPPGYKLYRDHEKENASCCCASWCKCCVKCCNRAAFMRPDSTDSLVILPFYPRRCMSVGHGMNDTDLFIVPSGLKSIGLSQELWSEYMSRLTDEVQTQTSSVCCLVSSIIATLGLACLCHNRRRYQSALSTWQDELNKELSKIGMFCKTQTHVHGFMVYTQYGPQRHEIRSSWLAIAIGEEAISRLQVAEHIEESGVRSGCRKGGCCQCCCDAHTGYVV